MSDFRQIHKQTNKQNVQKMGKKAAKVKTNKQKKKLWLVLKYYFTLLLVLFKHTIDLNISHLDLSCPENLTWNQHFHFWNRSNRSVPFLNKEVTLKDTSCVLSCSSLSLSLCLRANWKEWVMIRKLSATAAAVWREMQKDKWCQTYFKSLKSNLLHLQTPVIWTVLKLHL